MPLVLRVLTQLRRRILIHRRGLIALSLAALAWSVLTAVRPPDPPTVTVWAAARDLPSGTVLAASDLARTDVPAAAAPRAPHDLPALIGRTLGSPLGEGEVATSTQVVGSSRIAGYPGRSAVPVRIPDADTVGLLRPGDRVDLVGSDPQAGAEGPGTRIAEDAVVLALPRTTDGPASATTPGRLVVFAVPDDQVLQVASAASALYLTVIWNR